MPKEQSYTKQRIQNNIFDLLNNSWLIRLKKQLDTIIIKNAIKCGYTHKSFYYKNKVYQCDDTFFPRNTNRLSKELEPAFYEYLEELKKLDDEHIIINAYIIQVLNISNDRDDYMYLLPEALHNSICKEIPAYPDKSTSLLSPATRPLLKKNLIPIQLIKARLVMNLIT